MRIPRAALAIAFVLALPSLAACGGAEDDGADAPALVVALAAEEEGVGDEASVVGSEAVEEVAGGPPVGKYLCYYYGMQYDLTSSSLVEVRVLSGSRIEITGERVAFRATEDGAFALVDGPFPGLRFHHRTDSKGKSQIVMKRAENEKAGHRIDISDTYCYIED